MLLSDVLQGVDVRGVSGDLSGAVRSVCYDSRQCAPGSLFVAVPGLKFDGHRFIGEAISRGARFVVHEREFMPPPDVTAVRVDDCRRALGLLGRNFFGDPSGSLCLIGIVGTNGKTTITYLLESILEAAGDRPGILGTVNYRFGSRVWPAPNTTPESLEMQRILRVMLDAGATHVVGEISSHALDLKRADDCDFDLGVFTNLSQDHLDYHGTMEAYFAAKSRMFLEILPGSRKGRAIRAIMNADDPWGRRLLARTAVMTLSYGLETPADVSARNVILNLDGIEAEVRGPGISTTLRSSLIGRFNLYNILAAAAAAAALGIPETAIRDGVERLRNVPGRLEKVEGGKDDPRVFVDYAHTEDALRRVLENLAMFRRGRIITVFGCGGDRDRGKRPLMGRAAVEGSSVAIITSDNPRTEDPLEIIREIEAGVVGLQVRRIRSGELDEAAGKTGRPVYLVVPDRKTAIEQAIRSSGPDDIVLIAGKGHEDYQIIGESRTPFDDRRVARAVLSGGRNGEEAR
ncbi:MAG: UDP-N-acetylmuramoyl-L-alanyl-D-glutamate--2,6-diaminopimelate ligase [Deltaproteobacteria bacterium HGW-Deltaproteobacteria-19]|nr:MAG: UDP-N-acetylmuramoyl-L-alanyl-D-glutamate--2,6-diaminopimelate ligase [Deltaproteobacteria bacterium HGW-Deltaproteobacteria-19]